MPRATRFVPHLPTIYETCPKQIRRARAARRATMVVPGSTVAFPLTSPVVDERMPDEWQRRAVRFRADALRAAECARLLRLINSASFELEMRRRLRACATQIAK